ncbi:uncharacterized protein LOC123313163 isoform X3 [Coccinella septempunctata]|uniref:uncharacterized protein LOC123313163 isoform X3 n=1 Tax=Coccinella septempunctata TaxID=41139 RepID=UPI001D085E74|nr:uncharacterized protein LOC123313163 isoform X3 [Coccinella septempunctata]
MDHKRETDEEIEANRVIEYYKKYCQNPDLIKYFTGPEASCVEKKVFNVDIHKKVPLRNPQPVILSENVDVQANQECVNEEQCNSSRTIKSPTSLDIVSEHEDTEEKNHSRSSSVASNKIEWDNGADIGYKNSYQFLSARKSASFPSLLTQNVSVNSRVLPKEAAEKSISENIQELRKMYHQLTFSSETSSSVNKGYTASSESKGQSSSSPQENKNMKISTKSSSSSDSYLHRKIGHPVAYSTPHEESTSKESIPGSSKDVKSSEKHFSESSRESTSKSSTKPGVYSVTPMLTLSAKPKRNLNNDELFIPTEKESIVDHNVISSAEQVKESNLNVIKPETAKNSNHYRKKINLCLTKPISVECISLENKNNVHKDVQTSFSSDKSSKCIQTEEADFKSGVFDSKIRCSPQTQNIEYIRFGEETFKGASSKLYPTRDSARNPYISSEEKNCRATQTENVCSKNRKTKRVPKEAIDEKMTEFTQVKRVPYEKMYNVSSETSSVNTMSQEKESSNENLESKEGCYKSADNTNEFQAEEMLLAEMISLNYSKNLNTDIKRSINILQKLLKSRKYDNSTKKYYIKKIVQKIVESKYSDDSTSSDLFMPKKKTVEPRPVKETKSETEKPKSSTNLMDNLPWYPISEPIYSVPKNNTKKSVSSGDKKFTDDNNLKPRKSEKKTIAPNVTNENQRFIPPVQKDKMKIPEAKVDQLKVPLISPEDIHRSNNSATTTEDLKINQKYPRPDKTAKLASKSSSKLIYNPVPQKDYRPISSEGKIGETNWRTAKTLSEKLLENRDLIDFKNGQGDYLLHVVKNERNHQLSWINNEIEHLVKLKELLEKKPEKTRPDSKLKDVISSLLKMKENDMKGLPRNFEVFICKCKAPKGKCDRHCRGPKDNRKTQKKTACLTPGYYTIETQLDPDGNLLDLTVFDGSGSKKYNYKRDGVVDDVSISSKNHNTEVKLKPKAGEYPGRILSDACKECCACGRMFVPPSNDSEMSICEVCAEDLSVRDVAMPMRNGYKICKDCGKMFIPPRENPNICICQECYDDKPVSDQRPGLQSELCEACGRLFVRREDDSELCLCKRCKKELIQVERLSCHPTPPCNVCRDCGRKFLASVQDPEQCVCNECSEFKRQEEKRCSCQKVKFSNPLEAGVCKCVTRDFPNAVNDSCCSACGRESSQCVCGPKFVPKKPKLIGSKDGEDSYARKGSPCSHCIGVQANAPGKSNLTKCSSPRDSSKDWESKYCGSECPKSRHSITFDDECSKYCPGEIRKISQLSLSCPGSTQSSTESLQSIPNRAQYQSPSQQSAKKEKQSRKKAPPSSSRIANRSKLETGEQRAYSLQAKKSCQCCTCNNCSVQTKRPGDKNARCQCCVCENCGIQVSLDENGRPRKIIRSKWCLKHTDTKTNKKNSNSKSNRTYVECEKKKRRKKDELDCTDESLQSISSGNIICITPTKYKNMNRQKSDSTCQCTAPRIRQNLYFSGRCELEQHKSLQICPSVLKAICKSVNTSAHQERICSPNCQQATPDDSDSLKPKKSRSDSDHPKRNSQNRPKTKSNSPNPNSNSRETSKSICEPCDDDNSSTAPDDVSAESSPSSSSLPSRSVPPDESRSCESLDYPCKPLKPKTARVRDNSSEASLTCPSKKAVCPAKPPPCPGAGDKPCPSFPPRPCPNRRGRDREEDYKMRSSKSERRESQDSGRRRSREERKSIQENDSILLPLSIQSRSPLQELQDAKREYKRSEGSSRDLQTQDEVPSMPSTSPPKSAQPFPGNNKPNVQVYSCTTENQAYPNQDQEYSEQKKCTCGPGTCKCCQTATHEEKVIQCPAFRQCTCQTEPKEDANIQCNCKEHAGVSCNCDEVYQDKDNACKCKTSSSSSSSNSGSDSHMSCICCKKEKILKNLISKIPLCGPCQEVHRTNFYPHNYCDPNHSCICYNLVNRDLLCQFKQTLTELERLDIYQQYCEVLKNCKCCKKCGCKCKLPTKFKNGCAYFLKLEDACPNKHCEEEECDSDFFNCEEEEEEDRENYLPEVTVKVPNPRCSCGRKKKNGHEAKKYTSCPSIQNYLCTLKPDFIARAERRRRILRDATTQREENSEKRKLNFIEKVNYLNQRKRNDKVSSESNIYKQNGYQTNTYCVFDIELNDSPKRVQPRVFKSFREMKDLTRRRYLHLTEVKSKKKLNREKRLREANRLLANTFTRRLQRSTLRGNVDIPLNVKVVAY